MSQIVTLGGRDLDSDSINILRLVDEQGPKTTSEVRSKLLLKNNDYVRRRFYWLEEADLVNLELAEYERNSILEVTRVEITEQGEEFLRSWNFEGRGDGVPIEERTRRIEDRVTALDTQVDKIVTQQDDHCDDIDTLDAQIGDLRRQNERLQSKVDAIIDYLEGVHVNLDYD